MPDSTNVISDTLPNLSKLEEGIANALEKAIRGAAGSAGLSFAQCVADFAALALFFTKNKSGQPDELVILGPDIGALFIGAEVAEFDDVPNGKFYCRTGFGQGHQISIETDPVFLTPIATLDDRLANFFLVVEKALVELDVHVNRAIPSALTAHSPDLAPEPASRRTKITRNAIMAGCGVFVALVVLMFCQNLNRHHSNHPEGSGPVGWPSSSYVHPAPETEGSPGGVAAASTAVKIQVGGFGSTPGPDLESFGIHPGSEVANDVGKSK